MILYLDFNNFIYDFWVFWLIQKNSRRGLGTWAPELRKRILVVAIAPGGYVYKDSCAKVIHYRAEWYRDFVPGLDSGGAKREKNTIVTLKSHPDAPLFDHDFTSPTYREKLQEHITNYINSNGKKF